MKRWLRTFSYFIVSSCLLINICFAMSIDELERQANKQDPVAQYSLAQAFFTGKDVVKDPQRAIDWLRRSADNGYSLAQLKLASAYDNGIAIEQNIDMAVYWYTKAAVQGLARAQLKLGALYEREFNEYQNLTHLDLAKVWYKVAVENNSQQAELGYNRVLEAKFNAMRAAQLGEFKQLDTKANQTPIVPVSKLNTPTPQPSSWTLPEVSQEVGIAIIAATFVLALVSVLMLGRKKGKQKQLAKQERSSAIETTKLRKELDKNRRQLISQNAAIKDLKTAQHEHGFALACAFLGLNPKKIPAMEEIKLRYKKLCRVYHPDANGSDDDMKKLNAALKVVLKHTPQTK